MQSGLLVVPRQRGVQPRPPSRIDLRSKFGPDILFAALYNEGGGVPVDLAYPPATITLNGTAAYADGPVIPGLAVNGTGNHVAFGNPSKLAFTNTSDFTLVTLFYYPTLQSNVEFLANDSAAGTRTLVQWRTTTAYNKQEFFFGNNGGTLGSIAGVRTFGAGEYHMAAAVRVHGSSLTLYLDGVLDATGADASTGTWTVGSAVWATQYTGGGGFTGRKHLDLILNRALSASEILELYNDPFSWVEDDSAPLIARIKAARPLNLDVPLPLETLLRAALTLDLPLPLESRGWATLAHALRLWVESAGVLSSRTPLPLETIAQLSMALPLPVETAGADPDALEVFFRILRAADRWAPNAPLHVRFSTLRAYAEVMGALSVEFDITNTLESTNALAVTFGVASGKLRAMRTDDDVQAPVVKVTTS